VPILTKNTAKKKYGPASHSLLVYRHQYMSFEGCSVTYGKKTATL